jgi:hypothetical protein
MWVIFEGILSKLKSIFGRFDVPLWESPEGFQENKMPLEIEDKELLKSCIRNWWREPHSTRLYYQVHNFPQASEFKCYICKVSHSMVEHNTVSCARKFSCWSLAFIQFVWSVCMLCNLDHSNQHHLVNMKWSCNQMAATPGKSVAVLVANPSQRRSLR